MVWSSLDCYPGAGLDGSTSTCFLKAVDPRTDTHNVDGLWLQTRGNGTCRAVKHAYDWGPMDQMEPITELGGVAKMSYSISDVVGKIELAVAGTGVLASELVQTLAVVLGECPTGALAETVGCIRYAIVASTSNFYVAAPADDADVSDPLVTGFQPEYYLPPLEWANVEPAWATDCQMSQTWAREWGVGEMSVRGIGVRVVSIVVAPNGPRDCDVMSYSCGGDSYTCRDDSGTITIGLVMPAPDGEIPRERPSKINEGALTR